MTGWTNTRAARPAGVATWLNGTPHTCCHSRGSALVRKLLNAGRLIFPEAQRKTHGKKNIRMKMAPNNHFASSITLAESVRIIRRPPADGISHRPPADQLARHGLQ